MREHGGLNWGAQGVGIEMERTLFNGFRFVCFSLRRCRVDCPFFRHCDGRGGCDVVFSEGCIARDEKLMMEYDSASLDSFIGSPPPHRSLSRSWWWFLLALLSTNTSQNRQVERIKLMKCNENLISNSCFLISKRFLNMQKFSKVFPPLSEFK